MLLGLEEKKRVCERVITRGGPVAHTVLGKDNAISDIRSDNGAFIPHLSCRDSSVLTDANESF